MRISRSETCQVYIVYTTEVVMMYDNARPHTANIILDDNHPPHSLDLGLSYFLVLRFISAKSGTAQPKIFALILFIKLLRVYFIFFIWCVTLSYFKLCPHWSYTWKIFFHMCTLLILILFIDELKLLIVLLSMAEICIGSHELTILDKLDLSIYWLIVERKW